MPYKDSAKQKEYQRKWVADRRNLFFKERCCVFCGSNNELQLDHIDRTRKESHRVWSWSNKRRVEELSKCQILCRECHKKKTIKDMNWYQHSVSGYRRGCRCTICTVAAVKSATNWKRKNRGK